MAVDSSRCRADAPKQRRIRLEDVLEVRETSHEALVTLERFHPSMVSELERRCAAEAEVRDLPLEEIFLAYSRGTEEMEEWR